jgi:hypothetical protein
MTEINKKRIEEIKEIVGRAPHAENLKKEVSVIKDKRGQYTIRIPKRFAELAGVDQSKDLFVFIMIPEGEYPTISYTIKAEFRRG